MIRGVGKRGLVLPQLTLCIFILWTLPLMAQEYTYSETTSGERLMVNISKRQTEQSQSIIEMKGIYRDSRHYFEPDGYTVRWQHKDTQLLHDFDIIRDKNDIIIKGMFKGEAIHKTVKVDDKCWMNKIDQGLCPWVKSDEDEIVFWILKLSSDLDPIKFKAEKVGTEMLQTSAGTFSTIKVKLRLDGFLVSHLWSAYYWYREADGVFLKYEGASGMPGTPVTVIELESFVGR